MNPTLNSIFKFFENTECGKRRVEKIELSKQHKAMRLVLHEKIPEAEADFIAKTISEKMDLKLVEISEAEKEAQPQDTPDFKAEAEEKPIAKPVVKRIARDLGAAQTSGIIIGKEITANLIPIAAIN